MASERQQPLADYEVLLCVTGGIACYKSADLASKLVQAGAGVSVAMTEAAARFVAPLTFQTLTGRQVYSSLWQSTERFEAAHLSPTERADVLLIAPATADIIGKIAGGIADELVCCLVLSSTGQCPIMLAPAMNERMWQAPATQANIERLKSWGAHVVGPASGRLACGAEGVGRMAEPAEILKAVTDLLLRKPPKKRQS
ncbi:MAG TPA: flavoprotein [Phycisphaerae bacterium]|nr:flavoprotein [Phycisphaerae bacterium]HUT58156.1 flavoprotein [Phycisphaerae bacterium]